ncbi:hypothetical protein IU433_00870 [Nocardia puris]|uniref:Ferredoxin n=1 Tax=Nocardia puris TaxID=208602 RepID=A0A366DX42_9NOCA|nr:hypothetical protein [Nocardia puris]MBF6210335.1 hypothetical protein [Nocardia puris]MBF6367410.1 hypothetical protein [Nocardia puris]MBF6457595.1 hypothetical protein [Nocardia puris]RBO93758.1 hypothetical protein DFR74_102175 [Nocardia puris]
MAAVDCLRCGNRVAVVKFSPAHTSVQWSAAAARSCAELGDGPSPGCAALRRSIDGAVTAGALGLSMREQDLL